MVCSYDSERSQSIDSNESNSPDDARFDHNQHVTDDHDTSLFFDTTISRTNTLNNSIVAHRSRTAYKNYANATSRAERIWSNIVSYCKKNQITFVDDSFPPCEKSLFVSLLNKPIDTGKLKHEHIQWLRPNFIRTNSSEKSLKWTVYNEPKFSDIKQGLLGDCWLISGMNVYQ